MPIYNFFDLMNYELKLQTTEEAFKSVPQLPKLTSTKLNFQLDNTDKCTHLARLKDSNNGDSEEFLQKKSSFLLSSSLLDLQLDSYSIIHIIESQRTSVFQKEPLQKQQNLHIIRSGYLNKHLCNYFNETFMIPPYT